MSSELDTLGAFNPNDASLFTYLGLDPARPQDRAAVAVCRAYGFDPLLKHVVVIPKGGVYITRDGLLDLAHRSGQFDGMVVEREPELVDGQWVARVSVYRKDMSHPFTFPGRYPRGKDNAPEMALKCAEAHALRRAFSVTGLPTLDERLPEETPAPAQAPASSLRERARAAAEPTPEPHQDDDTILVDPETGEVLS